MANQHGGRRPGAGRKRTAEKLGFDLVALETVSPAEWRAIVRSLVEQAKGGNIQAAALLFAYAWGKPAQRVVHAADDERPLQIQIVEVRQPGRDE